MRCQRARLELRMELAGQEPRVVLQFHDLHELAVWGQTGELQPRLCKGLVVVLVELVAVAVALVDFRLSVGLVSEGARRDAAGVRAQPHCAAHLVHAEQVTQLVDHCFLGVLVELRRVGVLDAAHVAREVDHRALQAEADAEERHLVLPGILDGANHACSAANAEAAGYQYAVCLGQLGFQFAVLDVLTLDPIQVHPHVVADAAVGQGLVEALVGVLVAHVLAHHGDMDVAAGGVHVGADHGLPGIHVLVLIREIELLEDDRVE